MPDPQRARNLDRAERKFDVMQEMGAELVLVCSNTQPTALDDDERAALAVLAQGGLVPPLRLVDPIAGPVVESA